MHLLSSRYVLRYIYVRKRLLPELPLDLLRRFMYWIHHKHPVYMQRRILRTSWWFMHSMSGQLRRFMQWMHCTCQLHLQYWLHRT
jgi:hypothetical protein